MIKNNIIVKDFYDLPCHVYLKDKQGFIRECNDLTAKNIGYSKASDVVGLNDYDLCKSESASIIQTNDLEIIKNKKQKIITEQVELHNGIIFTVLSYKVPFYLHGRIIGIFGFSLPHELQVPFCSLLPNKKQPLEYGLSKRQMECLYYLTKGKTAKEIARVLMLSPRTVEVIISNIKIKLQCNTRSQLIDIAFKISVIKNKLLYDIAD